MMYNNSALTPQGNEVFDVIWANQSLKGKLFPKDPNLVDDNLYEQLSKQRFVVILDTVDNVFFGFIKEK